MNEVTMSENLIETNGKIFLFGFIMTLLEIPIIFYLVWKMILKNIVNAMFYDENEKKVASFYSFLALPIIFTSLNMIIIENMNQSLDKSIPVKRYLAVTRKYYKVMNRSKDDPRTNLHYIDLTSWLSNNTFTVRISNKEYNNTETNDVYEANTKSGFFGFSYYDSLHKIDRSIFPDGTKFPLNEKEAIKLIEEKKLQDLEEK